MNAPHHLRNGRNFGISSSSQFKLFSGAHAQDSADNATNNDDKRQISQSTRKNRQQNYWTLPRLYVGPRHGTSDPNKKQIIMTDGAHIPLSAEQTHYLTKVMRLLKKRKGRKQIDIDDDDSDIAAGRDCIRIFNGRNGEWLASVNAVSSQLQEDTSSSGKGKNGRRRQSSRQKDDITLFAECILQLKTQNYNVEESRPWVLFSPLKKQPRMKLMMEKCTELGVGAMIPVTSDRTEGDSLIGLLGQNSDDGQGNIDVLYGGIQEKGIAMGGLGGGFEKLEMQAIEASEQCERLTIPNISKHIPGSFNEGDGVWKVQDIVKEWCSDWKAEKSAADVDGNDDFRQGRNRILLICRERGSNEEYSNGRARVVPVLQALRDNPQVAFLVGPEGGWSLEEEALFDEVCSRYDEKYLDKPVQCVSLGSSVLRAETASMMAVGAWALMHDANDNNHSLSL